MVGCDELGTALNLMRNDQIEQAICHGTFFFIKVMGQAKFT
jgi:hypothetical protein